MRESVFTTKTPSHKEAYCKGRIYMSKKEYEPNMVLVKKKFRVVGTRPVRHDGVDKVTGRALYGADFSMAGLLHGAVLRSPHAHARIVSIDTSKAEVLPGVKAVVTA